MYCRSSVDMVVADGLAPGHLWPPWRREPVRGYQKWANDEVKHAMQLIYEIIMVSLLRYQAHSVPFLITQRTQMLGIPGPTLSIHLSKISLHTHAPLFNSLIHRTSYFSPWRYQSFTICWSLLIIYNRHPALAWAVRATWHLVKQQYIVIHP